MQHLGIHRRFPVSSPREIVALKRLKAISRREASEGHSVRQIPATDYIRSYPSRLISLIFRSLLLAVTHTPAFIIRSQSSGNDEHPLPLLILSPIHSNSFTLHSDSQTINIMAAMCLNCLSVLLITLLLHADPSSGRLQGLTDRDADLNDYVRWIRPPRESYSSPTHDPAPQLTTAATRDSNSTLTQLDRNRGIVRPILEHIVKKYLNRIVGGGGRPARSDEPVRNASQSTQPTKKSAPRRPNTEVVTTTTTDRPPRGTRRTAYREPEQDSGDEAVPPQPAGSCRCVPFYQCVDGKIVKDGAGIIDPRVKEHDAPTVRSLSSGTACGPFSICCQDEQEEQAAPTCGARTPKTAKELDKSRILSPDGASSFGSWPWQAAILKFDGQVNTFQCGGTLIDNIHVLTVAHCVQRFVDGIENLNELIVRLGEYDTGSRSELLPHEDFAIQRITIHHAFRNTSLWNDIALIQLSSLVTFKPHIEPVCLPNADDRFDGQSCATTGWGQDAYKGGVFSNVLKEAHLPVVDRQTCSDSLRRTRLGSGFRLHDSFLCAGGKRGVDSCRGDGGGPLVCYSGKSYKLAGLVSWGIECGHSDVPGVYVNVPLFVSWIRDHIRSEDDWRSGVELTTATFVPVEGSRIAQPPVFRRSTTAAPDVPDSRSRVGYQR